MSVMIETENNKTQSCMFYGFLNMCSVERNDTFVNLLSDQLLSKIEGSDARRRDRLQLNLALVQSKLYSNNSCYLPYTSSCLVAEYLKRISPTQKGASLEKPVVKQRWSTLLPFNFKESCVFCGEMCSLRPDLRNPSRWKTSILCRTADRGKVEKIFKNVIPQVCASLSMTIKI